mgnify:CR=1 FL=1
MHSLQRSARFRCSHTPFPRHATHRYLRFLCSHIPPPPHVTQLYLNDPCRQKRLPPHERYELIRVLDQYETCPPFMNVPLFSTGGRPCDITRDSHTVRIRIESVGIHTPCIVPPSAANTLPTTKTTRRCRCSLRSMDQWESIWA